MIMNSKLKTAVVLLQIGTTINVVASALNLVLIKFMLRNGTIRLNPYIKCVLLMTVYQMIYDSSLWPASK